MHYAAAHNKVISIEKFHERGCEVNRTDNYGQTPLHIAVKNGHIEVTRQLLNLGADSSKEDFNKMNVLHFCASKRHLILMQVNTFSNMYHIKFMSK